MPGIIQRIRTRLRTTRIRCRGARIGKGSVINHTADILNPGRIQMGVQSTVYKNVTLYIGDSGSFYLGDQSHVAPYCYFLIGNNELSLGDHVAVGPMCAFFCHSNNPGNDKSYFTDSYIDGDIKIGSNVFIGAQCTIMPGTVIHDDVVIGANSVVKGILESGYIYAGTPVKRVKPLSR